MPVTEVKILDSDSIVVIAPDEMSATIFLTAHPSGQSYSEEDILALLKNNGVKQGIDEDLIKEIVTQGMYSKMITVARGKEAIDGQDGYFQFFFRTELTMTPKINPDGSVDYLDMDIFEPVTKDQKIVEYHKATMGKMGFSVTGKLILPRRGKEKPAIRGRNFYIDDNGENYYSSINGRVEYENSRILISDMFVIQGNLTPKIGNVHFDGDVHIRGNVQNGMEIRATGGVVIDGIVESATIVAGKDIILRQGALGNYKGYVESTNGNIFGKFFEAITVRCKQNLSCNYLMNCDVNAGTMVEIAGKKGSIISGITKALVSIVADSVGNINEIPTTICVGADNELQAEIQRVKRQILKTNSEIDIFENALEKQVQLREKITLALEMKHTEKEELEEREKELLEMLRVAVGAVIVVKDTVYPGTTIKIDTETLALKSKLENIFFKKKDDYVAIFKN